LIDVPFNEMSRVKAGIDILIRTDQVSVDAYEYRATNCNPPLNEAERIASYLFLNNWI